MNHVSEEQLVEHFYGENSAAVETHLKSCAQCALAFAVLQDDLAEMKAVDIPMRDDAFGDRVWQSIAPSVAVYEATTAEGNGRRWSWLGQSWSLGGVGRGLGYAAACSLLAAGAFFAGRMWEQKQRPQMATATQPAPSGSKQPPQRVVVVVLGDHLDQSERLLVELKHADSDSAEMIAPMREEARTLLVANGTFREKARQVDDPELAVALKHLEDVLGKLANQKGVPTARSIEELQDEMKSDRLLFEVRVLRSRTPDRQIRGTVKTSGGTI
jgi:hypothetical protein